MGKVDFIVSFIMMKYLLSCQDKLVDYFHRILLLQRTTTMIVTAIIHMYRIHVSSKRKEIFCFIIRSINV